MAASATRPFAAVAAAIWIAVAATAPGEAQAPSLDVHFVPTPQSVVDRMLEMANVTKNDFIIDLGSGDGRIPITAATRYGARGMGVDLDPQRIKEAEENLKKAGVGDRVRFVQQDLFETDITEATVITMYLLQRLNERLRPTLLDLRPGTRIVSHSFTMADWKPDRHDTVDGGRSAYFWIVPANVEGSWQVKDGDRTFTVQINQAFQMIEGTARIGDSRLPLRETALRGNVIRFVIDAPDGEPLRLHGLVDGTRMAAAPGTRPWQAERAP
jgi:hypothetical protein